MLLFAPTARLPDGWASDVVIETDPHGRILAVTPGAAPGSAERLPGPVVPAIPNLHSHAFQRAMAGLGEKRTAGADDFWSWREVMYRFLDRLTPDDLEVIATRLYVEMAEAGYSRVCEFHYLHNAPDGQPYADPLETAWAHVRAARTAGIGLTLTPVLYSHGGFGGAPATPGQRRFLQTTDAYLRQLESLVGESHDGGFKVAVGLHSLRAVTPEQISEVLAAAPARLPVHIHVSEQTKEVEDCLVWSGKRPIQWLIDSVDIDDRWRLVHATHTDDSEAKAAAKAGAVAVLCPTTEGDLGDGFFNADVWLEDGGAFGLGTDSHVVVDPREELRLFEYGRRLTRRARGLAATAEQPHPGARLWLEAARADARGGGAMTGAIAPGYVADLLVLNSDHPNLAGLSDDGLFDGLVFVAGPGSSPILESWLSGRRRTESGRHAESLNSVTAYTETLKRLVNA
jgi:formimidoylglutamate deiminase